MQSNNAARVKLGSCRTVEAMLAWLDELEKAIPLEDRVSTAPQRGWGGPVMPGWLTPLHPPSLPCACVHAGGGYSDT